MTYLFNTSYHLPEYQHIKKDEYSSGVDRYWYALTENEIKEVYLKSSMVDNATNKKYIEDRNWFIFFLLSAYVVSSAKDMKYKMSLIMKNESVRNVCRIAPKGMKI